LKTKKEIPTINKINTSKLALRVTIVKKHTKNSVVVNAVATINAQLIHSTTLLYASSPFYTLSPNTICTDVFVKPYTLVGSNQNRVVGEEQYVISLTPLVLSPSQ
jgi:hypothetical protein